MTTSTITVTAVKSSQVSDVGYDPDTCTLCIFFKNKNGRSKPYHYANVSPEQHAEFMASNSLGTWFGANLKKATDAHPFSKIVETDDERAESKAKEAQPA